MQDPREKAYQHEKMFGHVSSTRYVNPSFLESLHRLDPLLDPRWNPVKQRWEIFRSGLYVLTVQTVSGEFAPLDNRVIQRLFLCDTYRYARAVDYIHSLHLEDESLSKMKIHEQDEFVRACHRDMKPFLIGRKTVSADPNKIKEQENA